MKKYAVRGLILLFVCIGLSAIFVAGLYVWKKETRPPKAETLTIDTARIIKLNIKNGNLYSVRPTDDNKVIFTSRNGPLSIPSLSVSDTFILVNDSVIEFRTKNSFKH